MRLIDADALIEIAHRIRLDSRERIEQMIESAPTVDAVEVVRCKDCKYYDDEDSFCAYIIWAKPDGYCSGGVKDETY